MVVTAGKNLCFDSVAVLIRGRSCLQTLLWHSAAALVPTQQLLQRLFRSALADENGICLREVDEMPCSVPCDISQQEHRRCLSWSPVIAPLAGVLG